VSREIPYQPLGQKVCSTTPEQMFAKLNARLPKKAGQSPQAKSDDKPPDGRNEQSPPGLVWSEPKKGLGFVYIDSGPYRITRENGKYNCHRESYYLGTRDSADAAKALCEEDLNGRR